MRNTAVHQQNIEISCIFFMKKHSCNDVCKHIDMWQVIRRLIYYCYFDLQMLVENNELSTATDMTPCAR